MTISGGLLLALFLLAPGLAFHAALFRPGILGIRFSPPSPGSIASLSIVAFGSLIGHAAWSVLSAINDAYCAAGLPHFAVTFEPNIYTTMISANRPDDHTDGLDAAAVLLAMLVLSVAIYLVSGIIGRTRWGARTFGPFNMAGSRTSLKKPNLKVVTQRRLFLHRSKATAFSWAMRALLSTWPLTLIVR